MVILCVDTKKVDNGYLWTSTLSTAKACKKFGGQFYGPLSSKDAFNYAVIETVKKLNRPVNLTIQTPRGFKKDYFYKAINDFRDDFKGSKVNNFSKCEKLTFSCDAKPADLCKLVEHDDYIEYLC